MSTSINAETQFMDAIRASGMEPPDSIIPDGEIHRFNATGKRGDLSGWYKFHSDGIPAGAFGDWRQGYSQKWRADIGRKLTRAERESQKLRMEAAAFARDAQQAIKTWDAAKMAACIWDDATPAPANHPYLIAKGINPHGIGISKQGALVIPLCDGSVITTIQFIHVDGTKRFLPGGKKRGCFFPIGNETNAAALAICEGYATGASIHEATGLPVAVAFDAGNLEPVALALRRASPALQFIICADDDYRTEGNPGLTKAKAAALATGALVAVPEFGPDRPPKATDFNDMHQLCGVNAVAESVASLMTEWQPGDRRVGA